MAFIIIVIGVIGVLNIDSLWRGTRLGDIANAIMAAIALVVMIALALAALAWSVRQ